MNKCVYCGKTYNPEYDFINDPYKAEIVAHFIDDAQLCGECGENFYQKLVNTAEKLINNKNLERKDEGGITKISLDNLTQFKNANQDLLKIYILNNKDNETVCKFLFKSTLTYQASGFSIGYGGEGPHGLHKAILMFSNNGLDKDFWATDISKLDSKKNWIYTEENEFTEL